MPWYMTPFGPQYVIEPGTIDEFERRDYVSLTAQEAADYFAGVAFPDPPSFATEAEVPGIMATVAANPASAFAVVQRAALVAHGGPLRPLVTPYARTSPTPDNGAGIRPMAVDPTHTGANGTGRLWGVGLFAGNIVFTDDDGATCTQAAVKPQLSPLSIWGIYFSNNFMWLLTGGVAGNSRSGQVWRSPKPAADGTGVVWTKVFDLTGMVNGPGGAGGSGAQQSCFRNSSFAIAPDESFAYLLEYGTGSGAFADGWLTGADAIMSAGSPFVYLPSSTLAGWGVGCPITITGAGPAGGNLVTKIVDTIRQGQYRLEIPASTSVTGAAWSMGAFTSQGSAVIAGPAVYRSTNIGGAAGSITWTQVQRFSFAKHGHAIRIINGVPWVALGDVGFPSSQYSTGLQGADRLSQSQNGMWAASSTAATSWTTVDVPISTEGKGSPRPINFYQYDYVTPVGTYPVVIAESDDQWSTGPLIFPKNVAGAGGAMIPSGTIPAPFAGNMRALTITEGGSILWVQTAEGGNSGQTDSLWIAAPPFDVPVLLEDFDGHTGKTWVDGVYSNGYAWFDHYRVTVPRFSGNLKA